MNITNAKQALAFQEEGYNMFKDRNITIDATRGKPGPEQVALCKEMLAPLEAYNSENGVDVLNYGGNDGLPEMKRLFGEMLGVPSDNIIVGGNSSLNMMFDCIATLIQSGLWKSGQKFLCPSPGYDRHFAVCEYFGLKMIPVAMTSDGPDMDTVEALAKDPEVAGMWCVPVFSNPQGYIYCNNTIGRLAKMQVSHPAFKLLWDDAYTVHHFAGKRPKPTNILKECTKYGNEDRPILFTSFSKISIPGAAVVCMAAAGESLKLMKKRINVQTIGPDKINQLRHMRFFKDLPGVMAHMSKHAEILAPKFEDAYSLLRFELLSTEATFTTPKGGYFISIETAPGLAKRVWQLCKNAGLMLTEAGATYPYGNDPNDSNLRFAPTFLSFEEIEQAIEVLGASIRLAEAERRAANE